MPASDGIGKAMAFQLAKKGMNVLLISRTESKLVDAQAELQAACPSVTVEHLAIDYSNFDDALQMPPRPRTPACPSRTAELLAFSGGSLVLHG